MLTLEFHSSQVDVFLERCRLGSPLLSSDCHVEKIPVRVVALTLHEANSFLLLLGERQLRFPVETVDVPVQHVPEDLSEEGVGQFGRGRNTLFQAGDLELHLDGKGMEEMAANHDGVASWKNSYMRQKDG